MICKIKGGGNLICFGCYDAKVTKIFARPLNSTSDHWSFSGWLSVCDSKMFVFSRRKSQWSCLFNLIYKSFNLITFKAPRPPERPLAWIKWRPTIFSWINEQTHVFHGINVGIFFFMSLISCHWMSLIYWLELTWQSQLQSQGQKLNKTFAPLKCQSRKLKKNEYMSLVKCKVPKRRTTGFIR